MPSELSLHTAVPGMTMPQVSGSTDVYLILGDPVEQVQAPQSFNRLFARFGLDAVLVPVQVAAEHLEAFVRSAFRAANIKGLWVTIPHKVQLLGLLDECSDLARMAGAVNAVRRNADGSLTGALFDGEGFVAGLDYAGMGWSGKRVLVIGAGGAAAAIGASLGLGARGRVPAARIAFFDPAPGKAHAVAARIQHASPSLVQAVDSSDPQGYDLVINASPLGLKASDALPCDVARMEPHAALADILMKNQPTPVLRAALARGLQVQTGFEMMVQQTPLYLDFFGFEVAARAVQGDLASVRAAVDPGLPHGVSPRVAVPLVQQAAQIIPVS